MGKRNRNKPVRVEVEFTEGYIERFTLEIMKMYEKRKRQQEIQEYNSDVYIKN